MSREEFPSLTIPHAAPVAWLQWKGTTVCMDFVCDCGRYYHVHGDFLYHVKCECGQVYELDGHIRLFKLSFEPVNTHKLEDLG